MATFTTTVTKKKTPRAAMLADTIGEVRVFNANISVPASVGANDTSEVTTIRLPANSMVTDVFMKASANGTADSGITLKGTTDGLLFVAAANANNVSTNWTALTVVRANSVSTVDQTLTIACSGANVVSASAWTADLCIVYIGIGGVSAPYSTFTS
jgi:hypothetical protein